MAGAKRIIPARAGFTSPPRSRQAVSTDHPRSRGVYADEMHVHKDLDGSSPLARGLPGKVGSLRPDPGIIPARAGFTGSPGSRGSPTSDHPRSRGVYSPPASAGTISEGSSPLARGLP